MCEHVAGLVDVCVSVFAHVYMSMWNPETKLGCSSSSASILIWADRIFTRTWGSENRLSCLANESWDLLSLAPSAGITITYNFTYVFLSLFFGNVHLRYSDYSHPELLLLPFHPYQHPLFPINLFLWLMSFCFVLWPTVFNQGLELSIEAWLDHNGSITKGNDLSSSKIYQQPFPIEAWVLTGPFLCRPSVGNCKGCGNMIAIAVSCLKGGILCLSPCFRALNFFPSLLLQSSSRLRGNSVNVFFVAKHSTITYSQHPEQPWTSEFTSDQ